MQLGLGLSLLKNCCGASETRVDFIAYFMRRPLYSVSEWAPHFLGNYGIGCLVKGTACISNGSSEDDNIMVQLVRSAEPLIYGARD
jgi:hypothetical protein